MIPSVNVKVLENPPVEMIDARQMSVVYLLCRCKDCGKDYTIALHQRVQCGECSLKGMYPPDGVKPLSAWQRFMQFAERLRSAVAR
jgi:hypothetical protein